MRQVDEELPAHAEALIDVEAVVDVRVVDQALPPDRGAGLLEVRAHHDQQLVLVLLLLLQQHVAVLQGRVRVVDRARADDNEQPPLRIGAIDDVGSLLATLENSALRLLGLGDLMLQEIGRGEGVVAADWTRVRNLMVPPGGLGKTGEPLEMLTSAIFALVFVPDVRVLDVEGLG